jgi:hypothetical protein
MSLQETRDPKWQLFAYQASYFWNGFESTSFILTLSVSKKLRSRNNLIPLVRLYLLAHEHVKTLTHESCAATVT